MTSETVLILTPAKNAAPHIDRYFRGLTTLTYPHAALSLGILESDSTDGSQALLTTRAESLRPTWRNVNVWKRDYGFVIPPGVPRYADEIQVQRRGILARSRNQLLFRALDDEQWVLWLDIDVIEYPPDIIERLLAVKKDIVQPHCVYQYGGRSFDRNAWRDRGMRHLDDMRPEGELVRLDAVGGTMLLVRADVHRDGLIFPSFPYGKANPRIRLNNHWIGEIETEGLGIMAGDAGIECWGMPHLEIKHHPE